MEIVEGVDWKILSQDFITNVLNNYNLICWEEYNIGRIALSV